MTEPDFPLAPRDDPDDGRRHGEPVGAGGAGEAARGATSRRALVKRATVVGAAAFAVAGGATALPKLARSAPTTRRDARILNHVLRLEYLKAAFYDEAARQAGLTGELQQLAGVLARHERSHAALLRRRLGSEAMDEPSFDFGDATGDADSFAETAHMLEETAVAAYIGQGANLTRGHMVPFAQIASVEARHAAWIADFLGRDPAPLAADEAKTPAEVLAVIEQFEARR